MKQARKRYTPQEKVALLCWHLLEKVPVSDLCDEAQLHPSVFYHWLREFFEHGAAAFERGTRCGMTHVKTSPFYLQSNGRIERWHRKPGLLGSNCAEG